MRYLDLTLALTLTCGLLAACSTTPPPAPAPAPAPQTSTRPAEPAAAPKAAPVAAAPAALPQHLDPNSALSRERSVFFEFDSSALDAKDQAIVQRHGQYLARSAALKVSVEGHTDERGGSEYNLALGQRRAEAVRSALKLLGVKEDQVEAVSYGKEKPMAAGHDEAAWQQNRRADIAYKK